MGGDGNLSWNVKRGSSGISPLAYMAAVQHARNMPTKESNFVDELISLEEILPENIVNLIHSARSDMTETGNRESSKNLDISEVHSHDTRNFGIYGIVDIYIPTDLSVPSSAKMNDTMYWELPMDGYDIRQFFGKFASSVPYFISSCTIEFAWVFEK